MSCFPLFAIFFFFSVSLHISYGNTIFATVIYCVLACERRHKVNKGEDSMMRNTTFGLMFATQILLCCSMLLSTPFSARAKASSKEYVSEYSPTLYPDQPFTPLSPNAPLPSVVPIDTSQVAQGYYDQFPFIRFVKPDAEPSFTRLTDDDFLDKSGKVIFRINRFDAYTDDALLRLLDSEILPRVNRDSLQLVSLVVRGASSPDGPFRNNHILGLQRTRTLRVTDHQESLNLASRELKL